MEDNVFTLVGRKLDEYEDELKTYLASGAADSMELYNRMVGRIEALRFIRDDLKDIETRYIER
jgi:hypothetical protein